MSGGFANRPRPACFQIIPIVQFSDIQAGTVPDKEKEGLRRTGVVVIRGVMPKDETEALLQEARRYFAQHKFNGFPSDAEKKVNHLSDFVPGLADIHDRVPGRL